MLFDKQFFYQKFDKQLSVALSEHIKSIFHEKNISVKYEGN